MTTQTSTARSNVVRNFISLSDLILRTLMKRLPWKKSTNLKWSQKLKDQDSVFIQSNKIWRRKTGARASAPAWKRPARSRENQSQLEHQNGTHKNSRYKVDRYKRTIRSVPETIHQSFQLASSPVLTVRSIDKLWSMRKRPFIIFQYSNTNFEKHQRTMTNIVFVIWLPPAIAGVTTKVHFYV